MTDFTAQELTNISAALLDYNIRGAAKSQVLQARPLFNDLTAGQKFFGGGKEFITWNVKGVYTSSFSGYRGDDQVTAYNPANIKKAMARWYEMSSGIVVTLTELKESGITISNTMNGTGENRHSDNELFVITDLLQDKMEDLSEGPKRSMAEIMWRDGTQDAKVFPGITSFITTAPTTGTSFAIDRAANSWWRNRSVQSINTSTPGDQNLVQTLQEEFRQLRRYTKNPKHRFYAGSDFMDAFERELRAKGNYTLEGWAKSGAIDASVADLMFKGVPIQYDPTLDDLGLAKHGFVLDLNAIRLRPMSDEDYKPHHPARPPEQYVMYSFVTWTGALVADQLNSSGRYSIL